MGVNLQADSDRLEKIVATNVERYLEIDKVEAIAGWVAGTGVENIQTTTEHIPHENKTLTLEFDKTGEAQTEALMSKVLASINGNAFQGPTVLRWAVRPPALTGVAYVFIRLGTDASNYIEWRVSVDDLTALKWNVVSVLVSNYTVQVGTGCNLADVDYIALGVEMVAVTDKITDLQFGEAQLISAIHGAVVGAEEITPAANINLLKLRGTVIARNAGVAGNDVLRVLIASDDVNLKTLITMDKIAKGAVIAGSGQKLTCTLAATDYEVVVVELATYAITAVNGVIYAGVADVQAADTAVARTIPAGDTQIYTIPSGTALHYRSDSALVYGRLARIQ